MSRITDRSEVQWQQCVVAFKQLQSKIQLQSDLVPSNLKIT